MLCLHVCLYAVYVLGSTGGQKRELNHLRPELDIVVSYHVGAVNQTSDLQESSVPLMTGHVPSPIINYKIASHYCTHSCLVTACGPYMLYIFTFYFTDLNVK